VDRAFVVGVFLDGKDDSCEGNCFAGEPGDSLQGKKVVCVVGERFVLRGISRVQGWSGRISKDYACLHTMTNLPESFLIVTSRGAAIFVALLDKITLEKWSEPCFNLKFKLRVAIA